MVVPAASMPSLSYTSCMSESNTSLLARMSEKACQAHTALRHLDNAQNVSRAHTAVAHLHNVQDVSRAVSPAVISKECPGCGGPPDLQPGLQIGSSKTVGVNRTNPDSLQHPRPTGSCPASNTPKQPLRLKTNAHATPTRLLDRPLQICP